MKAEGTILYLTPRDMIKLIQLWLGYPEISTFIGEWGMGNNLTPSPLLPPGEGYLRFQFMSFSG